MSINTISKLIFDHFVGYTKAYAEQTSDGKYKTIYKPINAKLIENMLLESESFLTYQFKEDFVKWICFDFDIKKAIIDANYQGKKSDHILMLCNKAKEFCEHLQKNNINYLTEFSGNRGIHIWIIFDNKIKGNVARRILEKLKHENIVFSDNSPLHIDEFPKSSTKNGKLGYGVKLPLSLHKKSNCYSYFININETISPDNIFIDKLETQFIERQIEILSQYKPQNIKDLLTILNIQEEIQKSDNNKNKTKENKYIKTSKPTIDNDIQLKEVLEDLSRCELINTFLSKYPDKTLSEQERTIIVGLLNRLQTTDDNNYGKKILETFFSKLPNYKPVLTRKKLSNLNLYPITCTYLKEIISQHSCPCKYKNIQIFKSPIELISTIHLEAFDEDIFELDESEAIQIILSQIKYTHHNDEIALNYIIEELKNINPKNIISQYQYFLDHQKQPDDFYTFIRLEDDEKERILIALSPEDKFLTTAFTKVINSIYYSDLSSNSYGYKFESSFANLYIFKPWLQQWNIYIKKLEEIIYNNNFNDYYLLKIDIKNFYSEISLDRLETKLLKGATESSEKRIKELDKQSNSRYIKICNTLIDYCKKISNTGKGVPQGPAFARYLAELYLLEIDKLIEGALSEEEYYFRYVDDIFIFLNRSNEDSTFLKNKIIEYIGTHELNISESPGKVYFGHLKDYRKEFDNYKDKTKYFIDQASKNNKIVTKKRSKNAINKLMNMIKDKDPSYLSFFLTHFADNLLVKTKKEELEKDFFTMLKGRGSMFRNFYTYYFLKIKNNNYIFSKNLKKLNGLNRAAFLNELLKYLIENELSTDNKIVTIEIINYFLDIDLLPHEKELILHIMLAENDIYNKKILNHFSNKEILKLINSAFKKKIPDYLINHVLNDAEQLEFADLIGFTFSVIFQNKTSQIVINQILTHFSNIVLEIIRDQAPTEVELPFNKKDNNIHFVVYKYYQILCLYSTLKTENNLDNNYFLKLKYLWDNFISTSNNRDNIDSENPLKWAEIACSHEIDRKKINFIIASKKEDNFFDIKIDKHKLFDDFYSGAIFILFFNNKSSLAQATEFLDSDTKEIIDKLIKEGNLLYIDWLQKSDTELYPDKDICLRNVIINDRLVLKNKNNMLVRIRNILNTKETVPDKPYEYLTNIKDNHEKYFNKQYKSTTYSFNPTEYIELLRLLSDKNNLLEVIDIIIQIRQAIYDFREKYHPDTEKFPVIFNGEINTSRNNYPLVPMSIYDKSPVITKDTVSSVNSEGKFLGYLLDFLRHEDLKNLNLFGFSHPNSIYGIDFLRKVNTSDSFFPKEFKNNIEKKYQYLLSFNEIYRQFKSNIVSAFNIEFIKIQTIYKTIYELNIKKKSKGVYFKPKLIYEILYNYHSLYNDEESHKKLIFDIENKPLKNNLVELYNTISFSIDTFIDKTVVDSNLSFRELFYFNSPVKIMLRFSRSSAAHGRRLRFFCKSA